jgi:hypothetical protein
MQSATRKTKTLGLFAKNLFVKTKSAVKNIKSQKDARIVRKHNFWQF